MKTPAPSELTANRDHTSIDPTEFCLPSGYRQQDAARTRDDFDGLTEYWTPDRIEVSSRYQSQVYRWAARLITLRACRSVLDAGSGPGIKIRDLLAPAGADITAVDQPSALTVAARLRIPAKLQPIDLERPTAPQRRFDLALCADVIEHLIDPRPLLNYLRAAVGPRGLILISTPDRSRLRGRQCRSCEKPEHVREWDRSEFLAFLRSAGLEIVRSRLFSQDASRSAEHRDAERRFRAGTADRSPLCCHAVLCTPLAARAQAA